MIVMIMISWIGENTWYSQCGENNHFWCHFIYWEQNLFLRLYFLGCFNFDRQKSTSFNRISTLVFIWKALDEKSRVSGFMRKQKWQKILRKAEIVCSFLFSVAKGKKKSTKIFSAVHKRIECRLLPNSVDRVGEECFALMSELPGGHRCGLIFE